MDKGLSDGERLGILSEKIDDMYATIMRQAYFTLFEVEAHRMISADGGATIDALSRAYLRNLRDQFGRSVDVSEDFAVEWSCIPHFYHSPFYCYAYSFGNLLSLSLFQRYKRRAPTLCPRTSTYWRPAARKSPRICWRHTGLTLRPSRSGRRGSSTYQSRSGRLASLPDCGRA